MKYRLLQIAFAAWVMVTAILGSLIMIQFVLALLFGTMGELQSTMLERWSFWLAYYAMATAVFFVVYSFLYWLMEASKGSAYHKNAQNYARDELEKDRRRRAKRRHN